MRRGPLPSLPSPITRSDVDHRTPSFEEKLKAAIEQTRLEERVRSLEADKARLQEELKEEKKKVEEERKKGKEERRKGEEERRKGEEERKKGELAVAEQKRKGEQERRKGELAVAEEREKLERRERLYRWETYKSGADGERRLALEPRRNVFW